MRCQRCGSQNVIIQAVTEFRRKRRGCLYWLLFGWIIELFMFLFFTLPWLIIKIFRPRRYISRERSVAVCQSCGRRWKVR